MVTLSGGSLGGQDVDGADWPEGETRNIEGSLYRRAGDQAVFIGLAE